MNIDLELYRVFCEVVKYKSISKAAENMYLSQSAVTQSIQKLEKLLGGKVFYRNKNGVELTEEGKNLYEYVKNSIETMSNAENIFSKYITLEKGKIRIGGGNALVSSMILNPMFKFIENYPNVDISISTGVTDNLMQKLANGEVNLVVLNLPFNASKYSNVEIIPLKKSRYCFFSSKKYAKENDIKDLEKCKFVLPPQYSAKGKILNEYLKENNIDIHHNYAISSTSLMKKMVVNSVGIGFAKLDTLDDVMDDIKIIKRIDINGLEEGIATLKKNMSNQATIELVKEIKKYHNEREQ